MRRRRTPRNIFRAGVASLFFCIAVLKAGEVHGSVDLKGGRTELALRSGAYDLRGAAVSKRSVSGPHSPFDHIAIWLDPLDQKRVEPRPAEMRQIGRELDPSLVIVPVGSTVSFPNMDPIFHNIFSLSRSRSFDLGYYPKGNVRSVTFPKPGVVQVYCHIHSEMYGIIVAAPSRWYGSPSSDGTFVLRDVDPGKYRLVVWQRASGLNQRKISVAPTGTIQVHISLPDPGED